MKFHPDNAIYREIVEAGDNWSYILKAGQTLRIVDLEGNQAADTLFYSLANTDERYSAQATINHQNNVYLTTGSPLVSNLGNVLLTITDDTCGRHDTIGGACSAEITLYAMTCKKYTCTTAAIRSWPHYGNTV